jgi:hypothetical protein
MGTPANHGRERIGNASDWPEVVFGRLVNELAAGIDVHNGDRFPSKAVVLLDQGSEVWKTKDYIECY